jgi:hypothetical protein
MKEDALKVGEQNIEAVKTASHEAFDCATKELDRTDCMFCFQNFIPYIYNNHAISIASRCFEQYENSRKFSRFLKEKAIAKW